MAQLRERYFEPRLQAAYAMLHRAAARGEIRADVDPELAFDLLFGPVAYRWLRGSPPDEETISRLVGLALETMDPARGGRGYVPPDSLADLVQTGPCASGLV